jgi:hypothetical protein
MWLVINPEKADIGVAPDGNVLVKLRYPRDKTGLAPGSISSP